MNAIKFVLALALPVAAACAQEIPEGIALPVSLNSKLDANKSIAGQTISASIAQDVPLPGGGKIRAGSRLYGQVLQAGARPGGGSFLRLRFDRLQTNKRDIALATRLRALASPWEVDEAQLPKVGPVERDPSASLVTIQVGEDAVYRGGGHVMHDNQVVGDPVHGGVLALLLPAPGCEGDSSVQKLALWVFSSTACGVYGFRFLQINHTGGTEPLGEIVLHSTKTAHLDTGSGLLLITVAAKR